MAKPFRDHNGKTQSMAVRYTPVRPAGSNGAPGPVTIGIAALDSSGMLGYAPVRTHFVDDWGWAEGCESISLLRHLIRECAGNEQTVARFNKILGFTGVSLDDRRYSGRSMDEEAACRASFELHPPPASLPTVYATARYVHVRTGEFLNVGVVAWREGRILSRFSADPERVRAFQPAEIEVLKGFVRVFVNGRVTLGGIAGMCAWETGSIQFDGPYTSPLPLEDAFESIAAQALR